MRKLLNILASLALALALVPAVQVPNTAQAATFDSSWTPITSAQNITKGGNYYLASDVVFDTSMEIAAGGTDVTLDLNGHAITFSAPSGKTDSRCVRVSTNTKLVLQDSGSGGKITGGTGWYDPAYEQWDGGGVYVDYGSLTVKGGTITGCSARGGGEGGGVYVDTGGSFTMEDGAIENCKAGSGGGVYVRNKGTFTMTGGTIENCGPVGSIGGSGGGVRVDDGGSFTMEGGTIQNCIADNAGGVYVSGGATFTMRPTNVTAPPSVKGSKDTRENASSDVMLCGTWANQTLATMYAEGGTVEGEVYMRYLARIDHRENAGGYTLFKGDVKTGDHEVTITDAAKIPVVFQVDGATPETQTLRVLNGQKLTGMPKAPVRQGYVFAGWRQAAGERPFDFDAPVTMQNLGNSARAAWSKDIAEANVELDKDTFTYNGEQQGPHVKRVYYPGGGTVLRQGADYLVLGQGSSLNAGAYTLSITGQGQVLSGTKKEETWKIDKANQTIVADDIAIPYSTTMNARIGAHIDGRAAKDGAGDIAYEVTEGKDVISVDGTGKITTATTGTAKVKIAAAGNGNYNEAPAKTITVRVYGDTDPHLDPGNWPYRINKTVYVNDMIDDGDLEGGKAPTGVPGSFSIVGPRSWRSSGQQQIQMRFTPDDIHYKTVDYTLSNFVVYARPVMKVTSPAQTLRVTDKPYGTALGDLGLPATATIEAGIEGNKKEYTVPVSWNSSSSYAYDRTSLGTQRLTGTLDLSQLSGEVVNTAAVTASAEVTLQKLLPGDAVFADKRAVYSGKPVAHELGRLPEGAQSASYSYEGAGGTSYTATSTPPTSPGDYKVTATFTARRGYEQPIDVTSNLTIAKRAATVRVLDRQAQVGGSAPDLASPVPGRDYIVDGLVAGDTLDPGVTVRLSYAEQPDMGKTGKYAIRASVEGDDSRYALNTEDGALTVASSPGEPSGPGEPADPAGPGDDSGGGGPVGPTPGNPDGSGAAADSPGTPSTSGDSSASGDSPAGGQDAPSHDGPSSVSPATPADSAGDSVAASSQGRRANRANDGSHQATSKEQRADDSENLDRDATHGSFDADEDPHGTPATGDSSAPLVIFAAVAAAALAAALGRRRARGLSWRAASRCSRGGRTR